MADVETRLTALETRQIEATRFAERREELYTELIAARMDSFQKSIDSLAARKGEDNATINHRLNDHAGRIDDLESWRDRFKGAMVVAVIAGNLIGGTVVAVVARIVSAGAG